MLDLGNYLIAFDIMVAGDKPAQIMATGQLTTDEVSGQASMLLKHAGGMHALLNTTLFSNTPGGAITAGRDATLVLDGQFYAPGNFTLTSSQNKRVLRWEESANRYDQLYHEAEHFAWCIGQGLNQSPVRSLDASLMTLAVMDDVRQQLGIVFKEEK